jgi:hypothetical protein
MAEYNGHPSYAKWNVALWFHNEKASHEHIIELAKTYKNNVTEITDVLCKDLLGFTTPDNVKYTKANIRHGVKCVLGN